MWQLVAPGLPPLAVAADAESRDCGRADMVQKANAFVSRKQFKLFVDDGELFLEIHESAVNPTLIRKTAGGSSTILKLASTLDNRRAALDAGDEVLFGKSFSDTSAVIFTVQAVAAGGAAAGPLAAAAAPEPAPAGPPAAAAAAEPAPAGPPAAAAAPEPAPAGPPAPAASGELLASAATGAAPSSSPSPRAFQLTSIAPGWGLPPRLNEGTVGIGSLLNEDTLRDALEVHLHSYLLDLDFLVGACPALLKVPKVVVMHGDGRCRSARCLAAPAHRERFVVVEPPTPAGSSCFHSKLILIRSDARLRLHVTSANLTCNDFANKTNAVWSGDFLRRGDASSPAAGTAGDDDLGTDLLDYLTAVYDIGSTPPADFTVHAQPDLAPATTPTGKRKVTPADARPWTLPVLEAMLSWPREVCYTDAIY